MDKIFNKISKYKYLIVGLVCALLLTILVLGDYFGRKKTDLLKEEHNREEELIARVVKQLSEVNSIVQGLTFIKQLENADAHNLDISSSGLDFKPVIEKMDNNHLAIKFQEFNIPSPAVYSIEDSKYGYPISFNYLYLISKDNNIIRKRLNVTYTKDTIVEFDFYTLLVEKFINRDLASKKIKQYEKEIAIYRKQKKSEQAAIEMKQKAEEKSREEQSQVVSKPKKLTSFSYRSTSYDIEYTDGSVRTNNVVTYHKFDLNNMVITQLSKEGGEWVKLRYKIRDYYTDGVLSTNHVFVINSNGVTEIWINFDTPNLGYDYLDGTRIACYGLSREE